MQEETESQRMCDIVSNQEGVNTCLTPPQPHLHLLLLPTGSILKNTGTQTLPQKINSSLQSLHSWNIIQTLGPSSCFFPSLFFSLCLLHFPNQKPRNFARSLFPQIVAGLFSSNVWSAQSSGLCRGLHTHTHTHTLQSWFLSYL